MIKDKFQEMVKKGGESTKAKYGRDHYSKMGKKTVENRRKQDPDYFKRLAQFGLEARRKKKLSQQTSSNNSAVTDTVDL